MEVVKFDHPYASISVKGEPDIESLQTELIIKEEIKEECDETSDKYLSSVMNLESELIIKEELKDDYDETSNQYLGSDMNLEHAVSNANFDDTRNINNNSIRQFVCKHCGAMLNKERRRKNCIDSMFCDRRCAILSEPSDTITQREYQFLKSKAKPFKCTTCDKVFSNKLSVMAHNIKEHVGEKCFTCPDCKQIFSERNDLLAHNIKLHPNDKRQKLHIKWRRRNNNQFLYKRPRP
ncbi:zinc finger protein 415-like [Chrysoperla carnea]|uniref:zinc finger protein 415-like n=1 Tax=Chrysoperla carnea TaxID=189513 RepID=UPI001D0679A7|nr:zinc finger protein 415-like [Chrysoperla carnea]